MPTTTLATWWTPQGFIFQDPPPAYIAAWGNGTDWAECLKGAGYEAIASYGQGDAPDLEVRVYWHNTEAHLFVDVWNWDCGLSDFFVAEQFRNAFFASWYVEFLRSAAQIQQAVHVAMIAKSLLAFVRHGHGTRTIDEYGDESYEERVRREEDWLRRKALKQQEKNKKPEETN